MITVTLTISDVTGGGPPIEKVLQLKRVDSDHLVFNWHNQREQVVEGSLAVVDWQEFVEQVKQRDPFHWATGRDLKGPMRDGNLPSIMMKLQSTPDYHLFLAGMDFTALLGLHDIEPERYRSMLETVSLEFSALAGSVESITEGAQLFVVSEYLSSAENALLELVQRGKLGRLTLLIEGREVGTKYYVPYTPPSIDEISHPLQPAASHLWEMIRRACG